MARREERSCFHIGWLLGLSLALSICVASTSIFMVYGNASPLAKVVADAEWFPKRAVNNMIVYMFMAIFLVPCALCFFKRYGVHVWPFPFGILFIWAWVNYGVLKGFQASMPADELAKKLLELGPNENGDTADKLLDVYVYSLLVNGILLTICVVFYALGLYRHGLPSEDYNNPNYRYRSNFSEGEQETYRRHQEDIELATVLTTVTIQHRVHTTAVVRQEDPNGPPQYACEPTTDDINAWQQYGESSAAGPDAFHVRTPVDRLPRAPEPAHQKS